MKIDTAIHVLIFENIKITWQQKTSFPNFRFNSWGKWMPLITTCSLHIDDNLILSMEVVKDSRDKNNINFARRLSLKKVFSSSNIKKETRIKIWNKYSEQYSDFY